MAAPVATVGVAPCAAEGRQHALPQGEPLGLQLAETSDGIASCYGVGSFPSAVPDDTTPLASEVAIPTPDSVVLALQSFDHVFRIHHLFACGVFCFGAFGVACRDCHVIGDAVPGEPRTERVPLDLGPLPPDRLHPQLVVEDLVPVRQLDRKSVV